MSKPFTTPDGLLVHKQEGVGLVVSAAEHIYMMAKRDAEIAELKELLREIRDDEVNAQDEADKLLRDHKPSQLSAARKRIEELESALDNERARGIHTCHDDCQRPLCVAGRKISELDKDRARLDKLERAFREANDTSWSSIWERGADSTPFRVVIDTLPELPLGSITTPLLGELTRREIEGNINTQFSA